MLGRLCARVADRVMQRGRIHGTWLRESALRAGRSARPRPHPRSSNDAPVSSRFVHVGHEREDVREQDRQHGLRALLRHDLVEARVALVRNAASASKALDDVVLDGRESRDPLRLDRKVVGRRRPRQPRGVLRRKGVAAGIGVELDDPAGRHRAEPLPHVALVEAGRGRQLVARRVVELRRARRRARSGGRPTS